MIKAGLIGCGGRGTGAAYDALSVKQGPVKLVAMADVFENRLKSSVGSLKRQFASKMDVPPDRQFIGFDAFKKAMDCLKPGDVAIFATPPAFRGIHFSYAIAKRLNVVQAIDHAFFGPAFRLDMNVGQMRQPQHAPA